MTKSILILSVATAGLAWTSTFAHGQVVGADNFAARQVLIPDSGGVAEGFATNDLASDEFGEPDHMAQTAERSIWWRWNASAAGVVEVDTLDSTFFTRLVVYTGNSIATLQQVAGNVSDLSAPNYESVVRFVATAGTSYSIVVDGYNESGAETGAIFLAVTQPAPDTPPANDDFADAIALGNGTSATATGDTTAASVQAQEPDPETTSFPTGSAHSVWYQWTAPSNGTTPYYTVQIDGGAGQSEPTLGIYQGNTLGTLTQVDKGEVLAFEPGSTSGELVMATFLATAGQSYRIMVAASSFISAPGTFELVLKPATRPLNDDLANATDLGSTHPVVAQNTLFEATRQAGEPNHFSSLGVSPSYSSTSIWMKWTAPTAGTFTADTRGSDGDTILVVYRALTSPPTFAGLQFVTSSDDINFDAEAYSSVVTFTATAGTVYYFAVSGYALSSYSPFRIASGPPRAPFEAWLLDFPTLSGADAAKDADPEHDGLSNLSELMLGTDPTKASHGDSIDGALLPDVSIDAGKLYLDIGYARENLNGLSDGQGVGGMPIAVIAQQSAGLITWTPVPADDVAFGSLTASASVPLSGPKAFLRFVITDPNP